MESPPTATGEVGALIQAALLDHPGDDEAFDDERWRRFLAGAAGLRDHGNDGLDAVVRLFRAGGRNGRVVAADLLGRMAFQASSDLREKYRLQLEEFLTAARDDGGDGDPAVTSAVIYAFGHLQDRRSLPSVLRLANSPSEEVRYAVACAIPGVCNWINNADAVDALVGLSDDTDEDVRNWACFGLGQLDADGSAVREALAARLSDEHDETRCEALLALAKTGDPRAAEEVLRRLEATGVLWVLEIEAAAEVGDTRFYEPLQRLVAKWKDDDDYVTFQMSLESALVRCDPDRRPAARKIEQRLLAAINQELSDRRWGARVEGDYPRTRLVIGDGQSDRLNRRMWDNCDPLDFNFEQERDSYLLSLGSRSHHADQD